MTTSAKARGLAFVAFLAAALYLVGLWRDWPVLRLATKPLPVLCLLAWVLTRAEGPYARLVAAGLGLSMAGDVLLEFPRLFVAGLAAFLCAHISYTAAFLTDTRRLALLRALPFLAWLGFVYARLRPGLGEMTTPVTLYITAIGVMLWRAAALEGREGSPRPAVIGALLFGLSDTLIGLDRFAAPIAGVRYPIILLYWAGQLGIASSVWRAPAGRAQA
jgi:alkenylglycerophosphocholine hydrolase